MNFVDLETKSLIINIYFYNIHKDFISVFMHRYYFCFLWSISNNF